MPLRLAIFPLAAALFCQVGCQRNLAPETTPPEILESWVDAPLTPGSAKLGSAHGVPPSSRVYRLDRLLDLFDAARFSGDQEHRESLWIGLGGGARQRGAAATRAALVWMLDEALALEEAPGLGEDEQAFLASAINLLTADLYRPGDADDLSAQTTAYRSLVEQGHPRVADNARWRLYDHIRGSLAGAASAAPSRRGEIATHALYAREASIEPMIDDLRAVHVRPEMPGAKELGDLLGEVLAPLAADPRWQPYIARRHQADQELVQTLFGLLPAPRHQLSDLPKLPTGTGAPESRGPIVVLNATGVVVDHGRPQQVQGQASDPKIGQALVATVAADGRGAILLAAEDSAPAPDLAAVLRGLAKARAARVEWAIHEPRLPEDAGLVVTALPFDIEPQSDALAVGTPGRLHVHLSGRGPQFRLDGAWLEQPPPVGRELVTLVRQLKSAYYRQQVVTLSLAPDVAAPQIQELLVALVGGPERAFDRVVWLPEPAFEIPPASEQPSKRPGPTQKMLMQRVELAKREVLVSFEQSGPLQAGDQQRIEARARSLFACIPELRRPLPAKFKLEVPVVFVDGKLSGFSVRGAKPAAGPAFERCVAEQFAGFGLHQQAGKLEVVVRMQESSGKKTDNVSK